MRKVKEPRRKERKGKRKGKKETFGAEKSLVAWDIAVRLPIVLQQPRASRNTPTRATHHSSNEHTHTGGADAEAFTDGATRGHAQQTMHYSL